MYPTLWSLVAAAVLIADMPPQIDLVERLASGKLTVVNRDVTPTPGTRGALHASEKENVGLVWIQG